MSFVFAMFGLMAFGHLGVRSRKAEGGGGAPTSIALKADLANINTSEAWVFW